MPCSVDVREICLSVGLALVPYSFDVREICLSVGLALVPCSFDVREICLSFGLALNVSSAGAMFSRRQRNLSVCWVSPECEQ